MCQEANAGSWCRLIPRRAAEQMMTVRKPRCGCCMTRHCRSGSSPPIQQASCMSLCALDHGRQNRFARGAGLCATVQIVTGTGSHVYGYLHVSHHPHVTNAVVPIACVLASRRSYGQVALASCAGAVSAGTGIICRRFTDTGPAAAAASGGRAPHQQAGAERCPVINPNHRSFAVEAVIAARVDAEQGVA